MSDWSSEGCSSDLGGQSPQRRADEGVEEDRYIGPSLRCELAQNGDQSTARGLRPEGIAMLVGDRRFRDLVVMIIVRDIDPGRPDGRTLVEGVEQDVLPLAVEFFDEGAGDRKSTRLNSSH